MSPTFHDPAGIYPPAGPYAHAVSVAQPQRLLFISGTMGLDPQGVAGKTVEEQLELVWSNLGQILQDAGMTTSNIVKLTCFLSDRSHRGPNMDARRRALGEHKVATTVVVVELLETQWLVEIDAVAAA